MASFPETIQHVHHINGLCVSLCVFLMCHPSHGSVKNHVLDTNQFLKGSKTFSWRKVSVSCVSPSSPTSKNTPSHPQLWESISAPPGSWRTPLPWSCLEVPTPALYVFVGGWDLEPKNISKETTPIGRPRDLVFDLMNFPGIHASWSWRPSWRSPVAGRFFGSNTSEGVVIPKWSWWMRLKGQMWYIYIYKYVTNYHYFHHYYRSLLSPLFTNININKYIDIHTIQRHFEITNFWWISYLKMAFISGPNPWKTLANLAASPTPFPLPGQERHRKTTVRASQRVASHQTRIFCFGKILSFSEVSWGCWRTFWTELWICFSQHLHMSKRLHVDTCLMFERPHRSRIRFRVCPSSLFFWPKRHSNLDLLSSAGWF